AGVCMDQRLCWIDHELRDARSGERLTIENPASEQPLATVPRCGADDTGAAVAAARRAQPAWRRVPALEKAKLLHEIAARIRSGHRDLARTLTLEEEKPFIENLDELDWVAA